MNDLSFSILMFFIASLLTATSQLVQEKYDSNGWKYFIFIIALILFNASISSIEGVKKIGDIATLIGVFMLFFYMGSIMYFIHKIFKKSPSVRPD